MLTILPELIFQREVHEINGRRGIERSLGKRPDFRDAVRTDINRRGHRECFAQLRVVRVSR